MQIRFLGTGAGDFLAPEEQENEAGFLPEVRRLGGRHRRYASSAMLPPDTLIDFYGDQQIRRLAIETASIQHLLITHGHWDHFQPLAIIDFARGLPQPLQIYGNDMVTDALEFAATHEWQETAKKVRSRLVPSRYLHTFGCRRQELRRRQCRRHRGACRSLYR